LVSLGNVADETGSIVVVFFGRREIGGGTPCPDRVRRQTVRTGENSLVL